MLRRVRSTSIGLVLSLLSVFPSHAEEVFDLTSYGTSIKEDVILINAGLDFSLPEAVKDALDEGVDLFFAIRVGVGVPKEWLPDHQLVNFSVRKRLGYHALTRKYTVDDLTFGDRNSYHSLRAALAEVGRLRNIHLIDTSIARANKDAVVKMRLELLISELPFPLRLQAALFPEWYLGSPWFAWKVLR